MKGKIFLNSILSLLAAITINGILFYSLNQLNVSDSVDCQEKISLKRVLLLEQQTEKRIASPKRKPKTFPSEIAKIDLDLCSPEPIRYEPVDIELEIPNLSTNEISIVPVFAKWKIEKKEKHKASTKKTNRQFAGAKKPRPQHQNNEPDIPPRQIIDIQPHYPKSALCREIEGKVTVQILIDQSGNVEKVKILRVEGHCSFRQAVLDVIYRWKFRPACRDNQPIKVWAVKRIRFELED